MAKAPIDIRSLARSQTPLAMRTLRSIAAQKDAPPAARVAAAVALLDRGWGKPQQSVEMTVRQKMAREMTDDELAIIAAGSSEGVTTAPVDPSQLN